MLLIWYNEGSQQTNTQQAFEGMALDKYYQVGHISNTIKSSYRYLQKTYQTPEKFEI